MICEICHGLGILPALTKNTKCSYCDWGVIPDVSSEVRRKAQLYDFLLKEVEELGYTGIGEVIDSLKHWKGVAENQAQKTIQLYEERNKILNKLLKEEFHLHEKVHYACDSTQDYRNYYTEIYVPKKLCENKTLKECLMDYFCLDHGVSYTDDQMICPECEREVCEQYDNQGSYIEQADEK